MRQKFLNKILPRSKSERNQLWKLYKETHTKRQATQHGSLPSLLGGGDKGIEIMYGEEKNTVHLADLSS